ncbi:MAG TPA: hypothetical protein VGK73_18190 [Polyangiaceae bacterium]
MALVHGENAPGASRLRAGFALTTGMDVAWALGFPRMAFIVDGVPAHDTTAALLELYAAQGKGQYGWFPLQASFGRLYPRRAAAARMYELDPYPAEVSEQEKAEYAAHIFELPDDEHDAATVIKDYSEADLLRCLAFSARQQRLDDDILLLEALCGPDKVLAVSAELLRSDGVKPYALLSALRPLLLRAEGAAVSRFERQIEGWAQGHDGPTQEAVTKWLRVDDTVKAHLAAGKIYQQYFPYVSEALRAEVTDAAVKEPTPYLAFALAGDIDRMLPALVQQIPRFEDLDIEASFLQSLSSLSHPGILPVLLEIGNRPHAELQVGAWFAAHGATFLPALEKLALGTGATAKLARKRLSRLSGS